MEDKLTPKYECSDFCGEFLQDLRLEQQAQVVHVIHSLTQKTYVDAMSICEGLLKNLEETVGYDSSVYGIILKRLCLALLKVAETDAAVHIAQHRPRLDKFNKEDFESLMILGVVYQMKSDYERSFEVFQRANDSANESHDNLHCAVSLVKMASSSWNLEQPELCHELTEKGQQAFRLFTIEGDASTGANVQEFLHLVDYHKTVSYLCRMTNDHYGVKDGYLKAFKVIKNNHCSIIQELKVLSQLSLSFSTLKDKDSVHHHNRRAEEIIEEILKDSSYLAAHYGQLIHVMNRLSFANSVSKHLAPALKISQKSFNIAINFLGDLHPEVGRMAAHIAVLCVQLQLDRRVVEFVDVFEKSLKASNYKNDPDMMKLYVRELTDALCHYAFCNLLQSNYGAAEDKYKEAIDISSKVYGETSLRTAKTMRLLARTYTKWGKYIVAREYFNKCLTAVEKYQPSNKALIISIREELEKCEPKRRVYANHYRKTYRNNW